MKSRTYRNCLVKFLTLGFLIMFTNRLSSQSMIQVWADEFDGMIDNSIWSFEKGFTNDNIHYYTDRIENAKIVNGKLQIIALKETYMGANYTSALLKTNHTLNFKYGRIEARIKLPGTPGFVPAFWMLPEDNLFGWWPISGEIDIMEHPTNQINKIYGTVHTQAYNSFTGSGPRGSNITIPDAETEFHVYAIEWTEEQIDFYVDEQKYYTFSNDLSGSATWPFNQPFYVILNLAVGGGWVGEPTNSTIFPAVMEIDYVRVYQTINDISISGPDFVFYDNQGVSYSTADITGASYLWSVPSDAQIVSGQNTNQIQIDWGIIGGNLSVDVNTNDESINIEYSVEVSPNLINNSSFEKGVKYWEKAGSLPAEADFILSTNDIHTGQHSLYVDVKTPGNNTWDAQLSHKNLKLQSGKQYHVSFWAKAILANSSINAAIINSGSSWK